LSSYTAQKYSLFGISAGRLKLLCDNATFFAWYLPFILLVHKKKKKKKKEKDQYKKEAVIFVCYCNVIKNCYSFLVHVIMGLTLQNMQFKKNQQQQQKKKDKRQK
jgi:hypothetical protein